MTLDQILEQALALSPEDRAQLAGILHNSLTETVRRSAWSRELDRRIAAYQHGQLESVDLDEARQELREDIERRRAARLSP